MCFVVLYRLLNGKKKITYVRPRKVSLSGEKKHKILHSMKKLPQLVSNLCNTVKHYF